jgi:hypothetical protein
MPGVKAVPWLAALALALSACGSGHYTGQPPLPGTPWTPAAVVIARAQAAEPGFRFFPNSSTSAECVIPGPGLVGVKGRCKTRVTYRYGSGTADVTFTESWSAREFRVGGSPKRALHHSWRYAVRPRGALSEAVTTGTSRRRALLTRPTTMATTATVTEATSSARAARCKWCRPRASSHLVAPSRCSSIGLADDQRAPSSTGIARLTPTA